MNRLDRIEERLNHPEQEYSWDDPWASLLLDDLRLLIDVARAAEAMGHGLPESSPEGLCDVCVAMAPLLADEEDE